ncbi:MAG: bifunctional glutamate N-acetyltransferase/amino-acid acetyltransferase ArgJ [Burkholderiales bacterium]|nr:bifunctional glutamate N-acetyltransferase/amino-acid acetyltransferase ArgJ [Phycisphaerae bacterium]
MHLLSAKGFLAGGVSAGIKVSGKKDVGLLIAETYATAAAAFTTNKVFAAPIKVGRKHIRGGVLKGVVLNSGNANACTGKQGLRDANRMCTLAAQLTQSDADLFLPSSTGIIGHLLPMDNVFAGIRAAAADMGDSQEHALAFTDCILTTDTVRKFAAATLRIGGKKVTITGICKGAGMIGPRMNVPQATMLGYLLTDAAIPSKTLRELLARTVDRSFNCVTIDNHMSTNDTAVLMASAESGAKVANRAARDKFLKALDEVTQSLARQIAADGEGATKIFTVRVRAATSDADARKIARAIADSALVKCAIHGNDPNWGRIVSAAGMCGAKFSPDKSKLTLQGAVVYRRGTPVVFDAAKVSASLKSKEVIADLHCGAGTGEATVWTCDFSKEYVTINADYHT